MLMEAAPDPLLRALEHLLEGDGQRIVGIFSEAGLLAASGPDGPPFFEKSQAKCRPPALQGVHPERWAETCAINHRLR
jgi:hypothetical protein